MKKINELMQKKMTRKEFLATVGFGIASIAGLSTLLKFLGKKNPLEETASLSYGNGPYGGSPRS